MNNAVLFFYNINALNLNKINNNYYFKYMDSDYAILFYNRDILEAKEIYYLNLEVLNRGIGYEIILTRDMEVLFFYDNGYYMLVKIPNIKNRVITYQDILSFNIPISNAKSIDKSMWGYSWQNKIDFTEHQFFSVKNKYPLINDSIDFFIGIWENAISYYNDYNIVSNNKFICHKRVSYDMDILEFLNPCNFVVDVKERDMGDYLKSYVLNNNYTFNVLDSFLDNLSYESVILLIIRILFPSYYFDLYEDIILDNLEEENILFVLDNYSNVISLVDYIISKYNTYNLSSILWIKKELSN